MPWTLTLPCPKQLQGADHTVAYAGGQEAEQTAWLLTASEEMHTPGQLQCMLPGIDLCNHAGRVSASCQLHITFNSLGQPL